MRKIIFLSVIFILLAYNSKAQKFEFYQDTLKMKAEILKYIPLGTDTSTAQKIMRKNKFKTTWNRNADFNSGQTRYKNMNYIYCDRSKSKGWITSRWQVALVHKNGKIIKVINEFGLIGP